MNIRYIDEIDYNHIQPQMARDRYHLLDGIWQCNGMDIRIPFPPESILSGYGGREEVLSAEWDGRLSYSTVFDIPYEFDLPVVLLHFGAVDQTCDVYVDNMFAGHHEGGYLKFCFDITDILISGGDGFRGTRHELRVEAVDRLSHAYPYGKQRHDRGGMWYTPVSGIWKSVWIENVPQIYMESIEMNTTLSSVDFRIHMSDGSERHESMAVDNPINWTVDNPHLYPIRIELDGDCISSYFALRTIDTRTVGEHVRVCLNGRPTYMHGILDQGYWSDGIYRPGSQEEYDRDILRMKELGFNMLRVHCKIEDDYFYTACDRLGMMVCQDMVPSGGYHYIRDTVMPTIGFLCRSDRRHRRTYGMKAEPGSEWRDCYDEEFRREFFVRHCEDTQRQLHNYPSVVMYTIFNEGWGQFDSDRLYDRLKTRDESRLYDSTSGWFAQSRSDFDSYHIYLWYKKMKDKGLPMFLSECGGYSLPIRNHMYNDKSYGYGACGSEDELTGRIEDMYANLVYPYISKGLCGDIYTQLSDVEDEINGMYTYDRQRCKVLKDRMKNIADRIFLEHENATK